MSTNIMEEERKPRGKGMQFVTQMTKQGDYFYLRIPRERNDAAKRYFENKRYLLVSFNEVEVQEDN